MKPLLRPVARVCALLFGILAASPSPAAVQDFLGRYGSQTTRGVAMVKLKIVGDQLMMAVWGRCSPQNCYWGEQPVQLFSGSAAMPVESGATAAIAQFTSGATQTMIVVRKSVGGALLYQAFTNFTDNSGRNSYYEADILNVCASTTCAVAR